MQPLWKAVWRFLKKLEIELPYDPAIPLLGIHTKETRSERDMCSPMFIAALFIIAMTWKQPRCPSADEWIRKLWYIYTMEYYSAIKKNSFESVLMQWMKLEPIIQSEGSQKDKDQYGRGPALAGSRGTLRMNGIGERRHVRLALMGPNLRGRETERERERERPDWDVQQSLAVALFFTVAFIP